MASPLKRPESAFGPANGLLRVEQFQMAYATNDIDRACALFSERFGISEFRRVAGQMPAGGQIRAELAWVGETMYELVTAEGPGSELYVGRLPAGEFAIRHHHLGFLIPDQEAWDALMAEIERGGWSMVYRNKTPNYIQSCFVDAPMLGHYLEYLFPAPEVLELFASAPRH